MTDESASRNPFPLLPFARLASDKKRAVGSILRVGKDPKLAPLDNLSGSSPQCRVTRLCPSATRIWSALCLCSVCFSFGPRATAVGVTVLTHGFESGSSYPSWVSAMADRIPAYHTFPGKSFTTYRLVVSYSGGYLVSCTRTNGVAPSASDSGEILVELDWSQISGDVFDSYASTTGVAWPVAWALQQTNLIAELGGHALAEFPIHLVGHSRGGSLVSEVSRLLGTNGVWVDHVTTLDPYPLNNDGNADFPATVVDAPVHTYSSVLFADNYWQNLGSGYIFGDPDGEAVAGAYVRQLTSLSGGYNNDHSNVHLWYHGTIDLNTPSSDGGASITTTERQNWWVPYEQTGAISGFYYSLIGTGNRLSTDQPLGSGFSAIRDGFNQTWDLGAGSANNRTALTTNTGVWPNLVRFFRTDTNQVTQGQSVAVTFYYQWARTNAGTATVSFYIDDDFNPLNSNARLLNQLVVPATGASAVSYSTVSLPLYATNAQPGYHALYASITGAGHTRYLYSPQLVYVVPAVNQQPPTLDIAAISSDQFVIGINGVAGQGITLQGSADLQNWIPLATNTLVSARWTYTNTAPTGFLQQFFRAVLNP